MLTSDVSAQVIDSGEVAEIFHSVPSQSPPDNTPVTTAVIDAPGATETLVAPFNVADSVVLVLTVTVSEQLLLDSLLSEMLLFGSTSQTLPLPLRGFASVPPDEGVAGMVTVIVPLTGMVTELELEDLQVKVSLLMEHETLLDAPPDSASIGVP